MTAAYSRPRTLLHREPVTRVDDVVLHEIDQDHWRVLDRRLFPDDVHALLGFIGREGHTIRVTLINEPGRVHHCCTLEEGRLIFLSEKEPAPEGGQWVRLARLHHSL